MSTPIKWEDASFTWSSNTYTWDEVQLVLEIRQGAGDYEEDISRFDNKRKQKLIKLVLKVYGDTITESKQREIKQYKIKAKDIRIAVKEVLGVEMIAEDVSI